mmetsp:Transcript_6197/g.11751  ORF Transcript_6197/g.11751 Transcript_6197/m.11751 type:complete len:211 (+) Transcript_6197:59-691(+)
MSRVLLLLTCSSKVSLNSLLKIFPNPRSRPYLHHNISLHSNTFAHRSSNRSSNNSKCTLNSNHNILRNNSNLNLNLGSRFLTVLTHLNRNTFLAAVTPLLRDLFNCIMPLLRCNKSHLSTQCLISNHNSTTNHNNTPSNRSNLITHRNNSSVLSLNSHINHILLVRDTHILTDSNLSLFRNTSQTRSPPNNSRETHKYVKLISCLLLMIS